jgi:hypothetical protein
LKHGFRALLLKCKNHLYFYHCITFTGGFCSKNLRYKDLWILYHSNEFNGLAVTETMSPQLSWANAQKEPKVLLLRATIQMHLQEQDGGIG